MTGLDQFKSVTANAKLVIEPLTGVFAGDLDRHAARRPKAKLRWVRQRTIVFTQQIARQIGNAGIQHRSDLAG